MRDVVGREIGNGSEEIKEYIRQDIQQTKVRDGLFVRNSMLSLAAQLAPRPCQVGGPLHPPPAEIGGGSFGLLQPAVTQLSPEIFSLGTHC